MRIFITGFSRSLFCCCTKEYFFFSLSLCLYANARRWENVSRSFVMYISIYIYIVDIYIRWHERKRWDEGEVWPECYWLEKTADVRCCSCTCVSIYCCICDVLLSRNDVRSDGLYIWELVKFWKFHVNSVSRKSFKVNPRIYTHSSRIADKDSSYIKLTFMYTIYNYSTHVVPTKSFRCCASTPSQPYIYIITPINTQQQQQQQLILLHKRASIIVARL